LFVYNSCQQLSAYVPELCRTTTEQQPETVRNFRHVLSPVLQDNSRTDQCGDYPAVCPSISPSYNPVVTMRHMTGHLSALLLVLLTLAVTGVEAFSGGDAAALIIGLFIGVLGVCSCLGYYARKRGNA
jgi:hypothetical protein